MLGHRAPRQCELIPSIGIRTVEGAVDERHPRLTPRPVFREQPHAARAAFAFLDQRLDERPEETIHVRLADHEVERELHRVALDPGHAVGPALLVDRVVELPAKVLQIGRFGRVEHALDYRPSAGPASIPPGGRSAPRPNGRWPIVGGKHRPPDELFGPLWPGTMLVMTDSRFRAAARVAAGLLALLILAILSACASPAAQAGDPPPSQVTAARALSRPVTEWNEFT